MIEGFEFFASSLIDEARNFSYVLFLLRDA